MTYSALGIDTHTGQRVIIHKSSRLQGLAIIGLQGTGKTVILKHLANQDAIQGIGFCLLDPHGDFTNDVVSVLPADREKDVISLDLTDYRYPFGINLFTCSDPSNPEVVSAAASRVMHIFKRLWGKGGVVVEDAWGVTLEELLWNTTLTFLEASKHLVLTMAEIPLFLTDAAFRTRVVSHITNRHVKDYWLRRYNLLSEKDQRDETRSTLNRVNSFLTQPIVEGIVGQSRTTINFRIIMDERKILLIKLSKRHEAVTALIGCMVIAEFLNAAYSRADLPVNKRKQFHIYADEFQNFATEDFATLLEEGRKFAIGTTFAHQNLGQIEFSLRERTRSVPNLAVFKINSNDAAALAGEFDITPAPERLEEIEKEQLIGHRPVRMLKGDVVGHLLHQGHEDRRVIAFVDDCLRILHLASLKRVDPHRYEGGYPKNFLGIEYNPEQIPGVLADLNTWLFTGMQDRDALWQSLPLETHWYLLRFLGITGQADKHWLEYWLGHHLWYEPVYRVARKEQEYAEKRWQEFRTDRFAEEAAYSGISQERLLNAAIAAVEAGYVDFLSSLFPSLTSASLREAWRQSGLRIPACTLDQMQGQSLRAHKRILAALLEEASRRPGLDAASYTRRFLEELSQPCNAVELFLPALYNSYSKGFAEDWRMLSRDATAKAPPNYSGWVHDIKEYPNLFMAHLNSGGVMTMCQYNLTLKPRFTYHLELLTDNICLRIIQAMQAVLASFLASLRFFAHLHCTQLALCQNPIETMESGQYEQDKRTQTHYIMHAQRAYGDMLNEVASKLTNLPLYTARVRIMTQAGRVEHTIRTINPKEQPERPLFGQALQTRLERIRDRNIQNGYLRERALVEEEIRQRQEQYREPPQEPPISRRPPR